MVTATKKKSHKELRAEAFNKVVGTVKASIEGSFRTGRADITLHHGKNIKGKLWEPGAVSYTHLTLPTTPYV